MDLLRGSMAAALVPTLLSACIPPPERSDPYVSLGLQAAESRPAAYPDLKVGLLLSETTRKTHEYLRQGRKDARWWGSTNPNVLPDPDKVLSDVSQVMKRNFQSVAEVRAFEDGARAGVDLVAVVDVYARLENVLGKDLFEVSAILTTPDRREIARVAHRIERRVPTIVNIDRKTLAEETVLLFELALARSPQLRAFAGLGPPAAAAGPAPPSVDEPSYKTPERPLDFALIVGIERYQSVPQAAHASRDAEAVRRHLAALGVPARNTVFLTDANAGYSALKKYTQSWLPKNVQPQSRLYFYFSGHGAPDAASGKAFLLPFDGDPSFLEDTALRLDQLYAALSGLPAKEVVVVLDACFSGAGGRSVLAKGARPLVVKVDAGESSLGKLALITAASGAEITATLEPARHGIFTYYFLKGLDGEARDANGRVTLKGLYEYLKPRVEDEARRQNRDQTPTLRSGSDLLLRAAGP